MVKLFFSCLDRQLWYRFGILWNVFVIDANGEGFSPHPLEAFPKRLKNYTNKRIWSIILIAPWALSPQIGYLRVFSFRLVLIHLFWILKINPQNVKIVDFFFLLPVAWNIFASSWNSRPIFPPPLADRARDAPGQEAKIRRLLFVFDFPLLDDLRYQHDFPFCLTPQK